MTTTSLEETPTSVTGGSLDLKEGGLAQGLPCSLSSNQNHDFRRPGFLVLAICFLYTPCTFPLQLAGP